MGASAHAGPAGAKVERERAQRKENGRKAIKILCLPHVGPRCHAFERTNVFVNPQQVREKTDGRSPKREGREVMNLTIQQEENTDSVCSRGAEGRKHPDTLRI